MPHSEAIEAARLKVEQAIEEFVAVQHAEDDEETGTPMTMAWTVAFEYTCASMEQREESAISVIVPPMQYRATSRGLLELAADKFR